MPEGLVSYREGHKKVRQRPMRPLAERVVGGGEP